MTATAGSLVLNAVLAPKTNSRPGRAPWAGNMTDYADSERLRRRSLHRKQSRCNDHIFEMLTDASVFSHAMCMTQPLPFFAKLMVKFSAGAEVFETDMGMRAKSKFSPG